MALTLIQLTTEPVDEHQIWDAFLSPQGTFYPCGIRGHRELAPCIWRHLHPSDREPYDCELALEEAGWVKISTRTVLFAGWRGGIDFLTPDQITAVLEWHEQTGESTINFNGRRNLSIEGFLATQHD